jgi:lauroyl/myristoyl acyltransferase
VPIVPAFCLLDGDRRYAMRVYEPLTVAPGEEEMGVRAWVAILEDVVRQQPTQWFNFFDVWHPFGNGTADAGDLDGRPFHA